MKYIIALSVMLLLVSCQEETVVEIEPIQFPAPNVPIPPLTPPPIPGFVTTEILEDFILLDLQNLANDNERRNARYFTSCNRFNLGEDADLQKQGIDLALNRLSDQRLAITTAIGPGDCIYRLDKRDFGIDQRDWILIERNAVIPFVTKTIRGKQIQFLTQTRNPYLFSIETISMFEGDAVTNRGGDIYYTLTDQPFLLNDYYARAGINPQREVNDENAVFAAYAKSGIAINKTREVAAYESLGNLVFTTFDSELGGQDHFEFPFTVELANAGIEQNIHHKSNTNGRQRTDKIYRFDAQESFQLLDNNLVGKFFLNDGQGRAQGAAPANVVRYVGETDPVIYIGSCLGCHYDQAIIPFTDQMYNHITTNQNFDEDERLLAEIFFNANKFSGLVSTTNRRQKQALAEIGVDHFEDPITKVIWKPYRGEMGLEFVAALTLLPTEQFSAKLRATRNSSQVFGNLLNGGSVNLAVLNKNFPELVRELNLFQDLNLN